MGEMFFIFVPELGVYLWLRQTFLDSNLKLEALSRIENIEVNIDLIEDV